MPGRTKLAGGKPFGNPATDKFENGQVALYSFLLREISYGLKIISPDDMILIKEQSVESGDVNKIAPDAMLERETLDSFIEENSQATKWKHYFDVYIDYKVVLAEDIPALGSKEFKRQFPKAKCVVGLSKVGFNKEWTQGIAMTEIECEQAAKKSIYWLIYTDDDGVPTIRQLALF